MIKGAGCLFMQRDFVLVGYNPKHRIWSGFGGKIEEGETPKEAAFRETIEELFGLKPSEEIIRICIETFQVCEMFVSDNYAILPLTFDLFIHIVYILRAAKYVSPYYYKLPESFIQLITERQPIDTAEITEIKVVNYRSPSPDIEYEIIDDCVKVYNFLNKKQNISS